MSDFTSTITEKTVFGNLRSHFGTFTSSGVTGGPIDTGLDKILFWYPVTYKDGGANGTTSAGVVSGVVISGGTSNTFPVSGTNIEIICPVDISGSWFAHGR